MQDCESFAEYPQSTTELRGKRGEGRPTPRDILITALRDLDSGVFKPSQLVIAYEQEPEGDLFVYGSIRATKSLTDTVGILEAVKSGELRRSEA